MILPRISDPPNSYRIEIPAHAGWLTLNQRDHWGVRSRLTKHFRHYGQVMSLHERLPRMELAHIVAELRFSDCRRRDPHNWMPTAKAVLDGMVDAGVFIDDNHKHVVGPDMRIGPVVDRDTQHMVIHVFPGAS